jgi:putative flippase GtrA
LYKNRMTDFCKQNPLFSDLLNIKALAQFKRYLVIGFSSFIIEYSIFFICNQLVKLWYIYSNSIAFVIVFWFNFLLNRYWSFQSKARLSKQLFQYGILFFINIGVSNLLMYLLSDKLAIIPLISKIMVMGVIVIWNFLIYKKIIYKD